MNRFLSFILIVFWLYGCTKPEQTDFNYQTTVDFSITQVKKSISEIPQGQYPKVSQQLGKWQFVSPADWTSGFYPGCLWYAYKLSPDLELLENAIQFTEGLEEQQFNTRTHDLGFMMLNSYGNGLEITDKREYKPILLQAAESLVSRYNEKVGCIQSWDGEFQVIGII